jgi:hypothetical protein
MHFGSVSVSGTTGFAGNISPKVSNFILGVEYRI